MRKTLFTLAIALCVTAVASVASSIAKNSNKQTAPETIVGYIIDKNCSGHREMWGNEDCAAKCFARGQEAVLVTEDAKVYMLEPQDRAKELPGKKVEVTGSVSGDTISITEIRCCH